ncbi:hypothetical protein QO001_004299 [Methylobacterium brachiatum]|uniref:Uncharacterized protein n=1 Tax=Methylobacterium brachiatum TaxID=269660 RepID=A0AAJ1TQT3_9HYPH|nr:hypothetical protein [Methylobacterium brachiatum]MCB4804327.1 hypothetical protein [Methylobacterium brachiatum]MDQ0545356.1 hypothetical protein [Methylobacterium brachiatum]
MIGHADTPEQAPRRGVAPETHKENAMLTGGLLWLIGVPIPVLILIWFFFLRGR